MKIEHPKDCKGCPDCLGKFICNCGLEFDELDTTHKCLNSGGKDE